MISIEFQDGRVFIHTARARVVLANAECIQALRMAKPDATGKPLRLDSPHYRRAAVIQSMDVKGG